MYLCIVRLIFLANERLTRVLTAVTLLFYASHQELDNIKILEIHILNLYSTSQKYVEQPNIYTTASYHE